MPYNLEICAICLKKYNTYVFKVENGGSTEKSVSVYKTTWCHVGDGHNISVIFFAIRTLYLTFNFVRGTAVAQWLRCCATNRKAAGSIPDGVIGIFH